MKIRIQFDDESNYEVDVDNIRDAVEHIQSELDGSFNNEYADIQLWGFGEWYNHRRVYAYWYGWR